MSLWYNLRFRNGRFERWRWACRIGWHAQRMRPLQGGHIVLVCACCDWCRYEGRY